MNYEDQLKFIAEKTGLTLDDPNTARLFADEHRCDVHAPTLGHDDYEMMEKELNETEIITENYHIYAWNDSSGYDYWYEGGLTGDTNYIQIEVFIKNPDACLFLVDKIKEGVEELYDKFYYYHNTDIVDWAKYLG